MTLHWFCWPSYDPDRLCCVLKHFVSVAMMTNKYVFHFCICSLSNKHKQGLGRVEWAKCKYCITGAIIVDEQKHTWRFVVTLALPHLFATNACTNVRVFESNLFSFLVQNYHQQIYLFLHTHYTDYFNNVLFFLFRWKCFFYVPE